MTKSTGRGRGGSPPEEHRYPKGRSGNPRGRPKKSGDDGLRDLIRKHLDKKVTIAINGKRRSMSMLEAGLARYANDLVTGTATDRRRAIEWLLKSGLLDRVPKSQLPPAAAIEKFVQELAEEARRADEEHR